MGTAINFTLIGEENFQAGCSIQESVQQLTIHVNIWQIFVNFG
jgi:hypothetical protein